MFARGGVASVHVNANMITVDLEKGHDGDGLLELIENLYRFYPGGEPTPTAAPRPGLPRPGLPRSRQRHPPPTKPPPKLRLHDAAESTEG